LFDFVQYHEASRRSATEQMGSSLEALIISMLKYPFIPELRNWNPVALGNLVPIVNNQLDQVVFGK
jgi:hypothetical protein